MRHWVTRLVLAAFATLATAILGIFVYDRLTAEEPDYSPVLTDSALDGWTAPWAAGGADTAADCDTLPRRWLVVGWDGADWDLALPLVEEGKLPNLERLMRSGAYGTLHSMVPTISPAIWTTVATGVSPGRHGITHFYNQRPRLERWLDRILHFGKLHRQLFTNADRRSRAVWNLLSDAGKEVLIVGYHNTFPVEEVDGVMVSNYLVQDSVGDLLSMDSGEGERSSLAAGLVYPPDHLPEILEIQAAVQRRIVDTLPRFAHVPPDQRVDFVRRSRRLAPGEQEKPYILVRAWAFDTIVAEAAETFLERARPDALPDLMMVHFQGVDWASHRFYFHQDPTAFAAVDWSPEVRDRLEAEVPIYRDTVDAFYVYLDEWLGRLMDRVDGETAVLVMSDHGFEPSHDPRINGEHDAAPPGLFVLGGPGIRSGKLAGGVSVYDVLPTLMSGLGLPIAEDLPGGPLERAFCDAAWASAVRTTVPTYGEGDFVPKIARPDEVDDQVLQQLESLGYLD